MVPVGILIGVHGAVMLINDKQKKDVEGIVWCRIFINAGSAFIQVPGNTLFCA
jgi:hypothetical protein